MTSFFDHYARMDQRQASEFAHRVTTGEEPVDVAAECSWSPGEVVAALAWFGLEADGALGPALTQIRSPQPELAEVVTREATLAALFPTASRPDRLALAAGLLQILDDWEGSHHAAQTADDLGEQATAAAWHLIAHRREPDLSNAHYWLRRARQDAFQALPTLARPLLAIDPTVGLAWSGRLLPGPAGVWDPAAWVEIAGRIRPGAAEEPLARRLQRAEMLALLSESVARVV